MAEYGPPSETQALIGWLNEKLDAGRSRLPLAAMKQNLAFTLGHQWLVWDRSRNQWTTARSPMEDGRRVQLTVNKIATVVEETVAKLTRDLPGPECRPVSDDHNDVMAAKIGTRILGHLMQKLDWPSVLTEFLFWPVIVGWGYMEVGWDPEAKDPFSPEQDGDVYLDIVPPFEMVVDPGARRFEDARWCIRSVIMTCDDVYETWGKEVPGGQAHNDLAMEVASLSNFTGHPMSRPPEDRVAVHQFWLRPGGRRHKDGMVVTWTGNETLDGPHIFPYAHGELPFVQFSFLPGLGRAEGRTFVTDLIPLQVDYNDARSREAHLRRVMTPKLLAPVNSVDPRRLSTKVEIVPYLPTTGKPDWMVPPAGWWAGHDLVMTRVNSEMSDRAGSAEALSRPEATNMPAASILALTEHGETRLAIAARLLARSIGKVGRQMLLLVQQFWTDPRIVRTWSADGELVAHWFRGSDVASNLDVHVSAESLVPRSKAARIQLAMQLQQTGLFPDPRLFLRMLDLPGVDFLLEHFDLDVKHAQRELTRLLQGEQVPVNSFDNHPIHVEEHNRFRKTREYEELPDEIRVLIDTHVRTHEEMIGIQMGAVPTPMQEPTDPNAPPPEEGGAPPAGAQPRPYLQPDTGQPPMGAQAAAGQVPSANALQSIRQLAGIGMPGQPGQVPGVDLDVQASRMGR